MALNPPNADLAAAASSLPQGRTLDINPLTYLEKIQGFDGRKEDLSTFCMNVDDIIPTLASYNEQAQRMCINVVKGKLTGKARRAMEIHPHLNNWVQIKAMLEANFGGFQTADQLYEDLRGTQYRGNTMEFYNNILHKLALLNQKSRQEDRIDDVERNIQTALKIFITRLPVFMRTVLCALQPTSMEAALHELSQSGFLNEERNPRNDNRSQKPYQQQPQHNWRPRTYHYNQEFQQGNQHHFQQKMYQQQNNQQFQQRSQQQNNQHLQQRNNQQNSQQFQQRNYQNHQSGPEPMDVDTSQQTRRQNHYQQEVQQNLNNYSKNNENYNNTNFNDNNFYEHNTNTEYGHPNNYERQNFRSVASPQTSGYPIFYSEIPPEI